MNAIVFAAAGVQSVDVDLPAGTVTVASDGSIDEATVRAAVDEAGFQLVA